MTRPLSKTSKTSMTGLGAVLLLAACTVRIEPSCAVNGRVDGSPEGSDRPVPEAGDREVASAPESSRVCPGPHHDGLTGCFPGNCGVGEFCDDPTSTCKPGCVSDANCGPHDTCARAPGERLGWCEPCASHEAHEPAAGCVDGHRNGVTQCFPGRCEPGQHCVSRGMPHCEPGCTSDDNCSAGEHCERKPGEPVGVCESCFF